MSRYRLLPLNPSQGPKLRELRAALERVEDRMDEVAENLEDRRSEIHAVRNRWIAEEIIEDLEIELADLEDELTALRAEIAEVTANAEVVAR